MKLDFVLDIQGEPCPYPVVHVLNVLRQMKPGQVLEVIADCPQSFRAVPEEAVRHGYRVVRPPARDGTTLRFYLQVPPAEERT